MLILNSVCMAAMSNEHLIASLYAQAGPLTSTPAEMELLGRLEDALDEIDERVELCEIDSAISEAILQYPEEDFLDKILDRINDLAKKLRGDNKIEADSIANDLFNIGIAISRQAEYGRTELNKIIEPNG